MLLTYAEEELLLLLLLLLPELLLWLPFVVMDPESPFEEGSVGE